MNSVLKWFRMRLSSRTVVVGLVTTLLGVAALFFDLPIESAPETLITSGLGLIYLREGIDKVR